MRYKMNFSLIKRGKYWYCRFYDPQGKRVSRSTGQTSKAKAILIAETWYKSDTFLFTEQTFKQYAENFFSEDGIWFKDSMLANSGLSKSTRNIYENRFRLHVLPYWSKVKLKEITPSKIKEWRLDVLTKRGMSIKSINYIVTVLGVVLNQAVVDGLITNNPVKYVSKLKDNAEKKDAFTLSEIKVLLNASPEKSLYMMILIGAITGMRRSEILGITESSLQKGYIDVSKQKEIKGYGYVSTKTRECRKIIVPECILNKLAEQLVIQEDFSERVCFGQNINYYNTRMTKLIKQNINKDERKVSFHSLRHFFNTYLLSENVSPAKVAGVLGHSTGLGSMTALYTNWKPEHFKEVLEAQEKLLKLLLEDDEKDIKK